MQKVAIRKVAEAQPSVPVFKELERRMEVVRQRAFDLFRQRGAMPGHDLEDWITAEHEVMGWPAAELKEEDSIYEMEVTLPGFMPEEIDVTATPTEVVVHAESQRRASGQEEKVLWSEFGSNDVYRRIELPEAVKADAITAELDNGLLRIKAPKAARIEPSTRLPAVPA